MSSVRLYHDDAYLRRFEAVVTAATSVVIMRAQGSMLDCAKLWKQLAAQLQGRGGGRPDRAEGKLSAPVTNWQDAVASALNRS